MRIALLATLLVAVVSGLLLWLGWTLVGGVIESVPRLPAGSTVIVNGVTVRADDLSRVLVAQAHDQVLKSGLIAFACVVLAAALLAWALTGRLLRPLHEVTATARKLSAESLGERIALRGPRDEVAELADTFDAMLDRLQATFDAQRRFVANASHELRTPLAVMRTELEVTLADERADVAELRRMSNVLLSASLRAQRLVDALLLLARTDAVGLTVRERVDLADLVTSALAATRADADSRELRYTVETAPTVVIGDPSLLERVAGNLLENAVRHNVPGGWIEVSAGRTGPSGPWCTLTVRSSGAEIPAERVAELFQPFRRAGAQRTGQDGSGLGLSIVHAVVSAHGGEVRAEPVAGGGLAVIVTLPAAEITTAPAKLSST
ncbi:MAG: HAMP domain-containing histidine kinase [Sciscionella sp.]|nr:HAMP domain-containing histidine kinase [Sciscionella sp.]